MPYSHEFEPLFGALHLPQMALLIGEYLHETGLLWQHGRLPRYLIDTAVQDHIPDGIMVGLDLFDRRQSAAIIRALIHYDPSSRKRAAEGASPPPAAPASHACCCCKDHTPSHILSLRFHMVNWGLTLDWKLIPFGLDSGLITFDHLLHDLASLNDRHRLAIR